MPALPPRLRRGRRLGDPVDRAPDPGTRLYRGRVAAVSVRASVSAGAWVGFALGLVAGIGVGALVVWFSGAVLDWQRDLAFTFGVARRLLPFGDQVGLLRQIGEFWWLVIPGVALGVAAFAAIVGGLLGGVLGAAYNRSPRHSMVIVELPSVAEPTEQEEHRSEEASAAAGDAPVGEAPAGGEATAAAGEATGATRARTPRSRAEPG